MKTHKNNTGGAWPIGALVMAYNWNPKAAYDSDEQEKLYEYTGTLAGFGMDYDETINGVEPFPTAIIKMPDGFLDNRPVQLVRFLEKHDAGVKSNTGGLISRILDFVANQVKRYGRRDLS
jgi:hypothetical protein